MRKIFLTLAVALGSIGTLSADGVTYTISPNGGQFLYQFTLTNTGDTGGTLFDLFLALPTDITNIDTLTIGTPVGWGDATGGLLFFGPNTGPGTAFIEWADGGPGFDLGIGDSLSGFSFNSSVDVGQPITFALNGSTDFATAQQASSVPEPSSVMLLLSVVLVIARRMQFRSATIRS